MLPASSNVSTLQIIISAKMIYEYYVHNNSITVVLLVYLAKKQIEIMCSIFHV
jgi:hypothetical protein